MLLNQKKSIIIKNNIDWMEQKRKQMLPNYLTNTFFKTADLMMPFSYSTGISP